MADPDNGAIVAEKQLAGEPAEVAAEVDFAEPRNMLDELDDVGGQLPIFLDSLALSIPRWLDPVFDLDSRAYEIVRTTDVTANPIEKFAMRVGSWVFKIEGPDGPRKEALQLIVDHIPKASDTHRGMIWAYAEGVRFGWIWIVDVVDGFVVPAISVRKKFTAGGTFLWNGKPHGLLHGERRVVKRQQFASTVVAANIDDSKAEELDPDRVIPFVTGNTGSPDGDLDVAWRLFNLAEQGQHLDRVNYKYTDRFGLPWDVVRLKLGKANAAAARAKLDSTGNKMAALNQRKTGMVLDSESMAALIEPTGMGWQHIKEKELSLSARAQVMILKNVLTSQTAGSGPTGSSTVHKDEEDSVVEYAAKDLGEAYDQILLPYIESRNEAALPTDNIGKHFLTLAPPPGQKDVTIDDVIKLRTGRWRLDTAWAYEVIGAPIPPDTPDVIEPDPSPFSGLSFDFLGGGRDDDERQPEPEPEPDDEDLPEEERALRRRHTRIKDAVNTGEQVDLAERLVEAVATVFENTLVPIIDGTFADSDEAALLIGSLVEALQLGHVAGAGSMLAEVLDLLDRRRQIGDTLDLDRLAALYEQNAIEASTVITAELAKRVKRQVAEWLRQGGQTGDTKAFVDWLLANNPNLTRGYARLVLRNATAQAYSIGRAETYRDVAEPIGLNRKVLTAGDTSVRPEHKLYERNGGAVLPPGPEFDKYIPPFDHNCRCTWVVTTAEAWELSEIATLPILPFNQGKMARLESAIKRGLSDDVKSRLLAQPGQQTGHST